MGRVPAGAAVLLIAAALGCRKEAPSARPLGTALEAEEALPGVGSVTEEAGTPARDRSPKDERHVVSVDMLSGERKTVKSSILVYLALPRPGNSRKPGRYLDVRVLAANEARLRDLVGTYRATLPSGLRVRNIEVRASAYQLEDKPCILLVCAMDLEVPAGLQTGTYPAVISFPGLLKSKGELKAILPQDLPWVRFDVHAWQDKAGFGRAHWWRNALWALLSLYLVGTGCAAVEALRRNLEQARREGGGEGVSPSDVGAFLLYLVVMFIGSVLMLMEAPDPGIREKRGGFFLGTLLIGLTTGVFLFVPCRLLGIAAEQAGWVAPWLPWALVTALSLIVMAVYGCWDQLGHPLWLGLACAIMGGACLVLSLDRVQDSTVMGQQLKEWLPSWLPFVARGAFVLVPGTVLASALRLVIGRGRS